MLIFFRRIFWNFLLKLRYFQHQALFNRMSRAKSRWVALLLPAVAVIATAQRIITSASVLERHAGGSVDFPCDVEGLNKTLNVVSWKKGDVLLAKDKLMFTQDRRLAVNVNGTNHILTISSLKGADSADYQCILAGEIHSQAQRAW